MYTVSVMADFIAQHYLTVPDPGPEGEIHSHHYEAELTLEGLASKARAKLPGLN